MPTVLSNKDIEDPERVKTIYATLTLSGSVITIRLVFRGLRAKPLAHGY